MNRGKTIRIFLVDGAPTGTLIAEIMSWTGKVVVVSRSQLADAAKRSESRRTGVYFLVGPDPGNPTREWVYIGEADDVMKRLAIHDRDENRNFWQRTVFIVGKDENITKAHARYLESRLIQLANEANRARVMNGTAPPVPGLPETDIVDMEDFLDHVKMMLPVLGFGFLQSIPGPGPVLPKSPLFRLTTAGVRAEARVIDGQFVVLKGATARKQGVESWTSYRGLRAELIESGRIVDGVDPQLLVFAENVAFDSPSAAGAVILGANTNGRIAWKTADTGKSYADWQAASSRLPGWIRPLTRSDSVAAGFAAGRRRHLAGVLVLMAHDHRRAETAPSRPDLIPGLPYRTEPFVQPLGGCLIFGQDFQYGRHLARRNSQRDVAREYCQLAVFRLLKQERCADSLPREDIEQSWRCRHADLAIATPLGAPPRGKLAIEFGQGGIP